MLKLLALGALGYAGYRYYQTNRAGRSHTGEQPDTSDPHVAMAGGPLSEEATVVESGQPLPAG